METERRHEITRLIKSRAHDLGFAACGIVEARPLEEERERFENWLANGFHGEMQYMTRNKDKRLDPVSLVPGAKSVIILLFNYFPAKSFPEADNYKIAKYAYGRDYHDVIREKLQLLITEITGLTGSIQARSFTDSAPVLERAWAEKAGTGWIGKNTCLIHPQIGSFVFIAEIITDLELEYDTNRVNDLCGGCTRCIEACPTGALVAPRILDSRKCISYLTIEYREELPPGERDKFSDWIFGCDICQDVCPWNRKSRPHEETAFMPLPELYSMNKTMWREMTREDFQRIFKGSAVKRTKFEGLKRNIDFLKSEEI